MIGWIGRILVGLVTAVVSVAPVATAQAGGAFPTANVEVVCDAGQGFIVVEISGSREFRFDVLIDDETVGKAVGAGSYDYGPYANGTYPVTVVWLAGKGLVTLYDDEVTVDCEPDGTTSTTGGATVTTEPSVTPTTPAARSAARAVTSPRFTG
jgi:hypothetical protein